MLNKFWNGKILGLPHAFLIILDRLIIGLNNKFTTLLVRHNFAKCGENVIINRGIHYRNPSKIYIGNNVIIDMRAVLFTELPNDGGDLIIKDQVTIGQDCRIDFTGGVTLSKNSHLAPFVNILTHDHGYNHKNAPVGKHLTIEENAFVGTRVQILHNVSNIGKNSVIGVGSIVTKDVPENAIVAGCPAKIIGYISENKVNLK